MSSSEAASAKIGADEKNDVNNQQPAKQSTGISSGCATFIALLAVSLTIAGLGVVAGTSGTAIVKGVPRAAIVVFEGFKGTSFEELLALQKLPNIAYLAAQGKRSVCNSIDDARCARTQSGQFLGADFTWTSGPGIASILTGVNADKHQVKNDTFDDYAKFSVTSTTYPSLLAQARTSGFTTRAVGSSHLLTSPASSSPSAPCTQLGVADFECGADAVGRCLQTTSCNINTRKTIAPVTDFLGTEEQALDDAVAAAFSSNIADLLVIHSDKLSRIATDPAYPSASFSSSSQEYAAEAYVLDSVVGQLSLLIKQRVEKFQENWLVVLTSDHGGQDKTFGTHTDQDEVIPFIVATMTSNGNLALKELHTPTTQMDVAPTVLSWLGVAVPSNLDGVVQGICSSGVVPSDCVSS